VNILPFLSAGFLLINPVLLAFFKRFEIQLEKLQFWVMVSSGSAWVFAASLLLLNPQSHLNPIWNAGEELLPSLAFSVDWISTALSLSVCGALFYIVLSRQESPLENALLSGLTGVSVLGLFADSAYTLALFWTVLELFHFSMAVSRPERGRISNNSLLGPLLRLAAPVILIWVTLIGSGTGGTRFLTDWDSSAAYPLLAAGFIGFLSWFPGKSSYRAENVESSQTALQSWIPAALGSMVMIRAGTLLGDAGGVTAIPIVISVLLVLTAAGGALLDTADSWWFVGCGLLVAGSAALADPVSALSWGLVFMLPGCLFWSVRDQAQPTYLLLGLGGLGILPLPFLPAWTGMGVFQSGLSGILLAVGCGLFLGALVIAGLKSLSRVGESKEGLSPLIIIGSGILLLSQVLIAFRLGLLEMGRGLLSRPAVIWLAPLMIVLSLIAGNWVPLRGKDLIVKRLTRVAERLKQFILAIIQLVRWIVSFLIGLLERDGGLIWALLLGFLILTLISLRGGR
jgi:hypothetical protein